AAADAAMATASASGSGDSLIGGGSGVAAAEARARARKVASNILRAAGRRIPRFADLYLDMTSPCPRLDGCPPTVRRRVALQVAGRGAATSGGRTGGRTGAVATREMPP